MSLSPVEVAYHELSAYTLTHGDPAFLHQHVVDAFAAQSANAESKRIGVAFALFGLCLHVEFGFTGREVQLAHMALARARREWPAYSLPASRGAMTPLEVMATPEGPMRDAAIHEWCRTVWEAVSTCRAEVLRDLRIHGILPSSEA